MITKKNNKQMYLFLYGFLFAIGAFLTYFAINQYKQTKSILINGTRTQAEVVDFEKYFDGDSKIYNPVLEYLHKSGNKIRYTHEIGSAKPDYNIGTNIPIVYDNSNDQNVKIISFWGLYRWTIILLSLASPFLIIGGGYLLYSF